MQTFKQHLLENIELANIDIKTALDYIDKQLGDKLKDIPNIESNIIFAQKQAKLGWTKRKNMPVIKTKDVKLFQTRLEKGSIDIKTPYAKATNKLNPFPQGLNPDTAKSWLTNGLKRFDGSEKDDKVKVVNKKIEVKKLKPIQQQIYFDKSVKALKKDSLDIVKKHLTQNTIFITSSDNYIIDGHHRYLTSMIIDPNLKVNIMAIDLPINILLPLSVAYGDAIGNTRNEEFTFRNYCQS